MLMTREEKIKLCDLMLKKRVDIPYLLMCVDYTCLFPNEPRFEIAVERYNAKGFYKRYQLNEKELVMIWNGVQTKKRNKNKR